MRERINPNEFEFEERPIDINRVMRVRKGGRTPSFNALSVVGDQSGVVGLGFGSANEIPSAMGKSIADAKKIWFVYLYQEIPFLMKLSGSTAVQRCYSNPPALVRGLLQVPEPESFWSLPVCEMY